MSRFTEWLREEIRKSGSGVMELARGMGAPHPSVSRWLSGKREPSSRSCMKLAHFFNVPEEYVLELAGHKTMAAEEPEIPDPELRGYAKQLGLLDEHDAEIITAQLRVMLGRKKGRGRRRQ